MKPSSCVLIGSLALNVLIGAALYRYPASAAAAPHASRLASAPASASSSLAPPTAATLPGLEPAALRAALQQLNLPREAIDALVLTKIYARHDARRHELMVETARFPWWQTAAAGWDRLSLLTPDQRKELRHLAAVARNEAVGLLGPAAVDRDGAMAAAYPYVSADRAVLLDGLVRDYREMNTMLREEMHGLRTAKDRDAEAWVEGQRQRDLEKLLSPSEREILELRDPATTSALSSRAFTFEPSEAEYRALSAIYRDFYASHPASVDVEGRSRAAPFDEYPDYAEKIRATLGEARYADWSLGAQRYTATLTRLAPDYGFTPAQVRDSAMLLRDTAARSWSIGEDTSASPDEKRAALATLAAETRRTLTTQLGDTASAAVQRDAKWLDAIADGTAVKVEGYSVRSMPVQSFRPPSRPAAATPPRL